MRDHARTLSWRAAWDSTRATSGTHFEAFRKLKRLLHNLSGISEDQGRGRIPKSAHEQFSAGQRPPDPSTALSTKVLSAAVHFSWEGKAVPPMVLLPLIGSLWFYLHFSLRRGS